MVAVLVQPCPSGQSSDSVYGGCVQSAPAGQLKGAGPSAVVVGPIQTTVIVVKTVDIEKTMLVWPFGSTV